MSYPSRNPHQNPVWLSDELHEWVKDRAEMAGRTFSAEVRAILQAVHDEQRAEALDADLVKMLDMARDEGYDDARLALSTRLRNVPLPRAMDGSPLDRLVKAVTDWILHSRRVG